MTPDTMLGQARAFADQLRAGERLARGVLADTTAIRHVVVCGLGGSAAGARLAAGLLETTLTIPVTIPTATSLPPLRADDTLVVIVSYSGATREALDWYHAAGLRGARRVVITAGGPLADQAAADATPIIRVEAGYQPRGALGLLLAPLLVLLGEAGACPDPGVLIGRGADAAERVFETRDADARAAASRLAGSVPVFYGAGPRAAVAVRLKNQVNENAKMAAFAGAVPEIAHNEILGWIQTRRVPLRFSAVFLRDRDEPVGIAAITDGLEQLVVSDGAMVERWAGDGDDEQTRVFALLAFGDLVSCYLADEDGVDAMDITRLTDLKARLAAAG